MFALGRQECVERWAQRHCVNHHLSAAFKFEPDDLQQIPCAVRADGEDPGRVGGWIEFDDGEGVLESVQDRVAVEAVLERRAMELHTQLS